MTLGTGNGDLAVTPGHRAELVAGGNGSVCVGYTTVPWLTMGVRQRAPERGETLIELLVTISIIGIGMIALVGGLATAITASSAHRQQADAGAVARNIAEAIKDTTVPLNANGDYAASTWSDVTVPAGVTVSVPTARCWNGDPDASLEQCLGRLPELQWSPEDHGYRDGERR